ncbi:PAQR family membrane homeostasis protein TrhA [Candidatus Laterigemmans baculatus]|uniref:PAQR family membrane homeostasis protein TrhA n=1 Tax=Candidatus Laterigemmans baculatus TaxID=2770505 RepID=UPI0013DB435A|nr:hemolysin III family protein [Candidatus Laterigemmans baculatus]
MNSLPSHSAPSDVVYLSVADERANTATHALGFVLSLVAAVYLAQQTAAESLGFTVSCTVFAISMAAVYLFSTLSHAVYEPLWRHRMRAWDQGVIYTLIAGTYTPFIWVCSPAGWRSAILLAVWLAAAIGFYSKVLAAHRVNGISTVTYVLLGWLPAIPLVPRTPTICLLWMLAGGVAYTAGILFLRLDGRYRYFHAMWHLMVIAGSACHFIAIQYLVEYASTSGMPG